MSLPTVNRLYLIREHRLHGTVTGVESVRIMTSNEDSLDRLLISFKDAKVGVQFCQTLHLKLIQFQIALLEWSEAAEDVVTVSIHTYERAPQLVSKSNLH